MMLRIPILVLVVLSRVYAQDPNAFTFHHTAAVAPAKFEGRQSGPFGLPFVASPRLSFFPQPGVPKPLKGKEALVRAALRVGKDGRVKEARLIDCTVDRDLVEKEALDFFRRIVYQPEVRDKKAIDFETDALLQFREKPRKGG